MADTTAPIADLQALSHRIDEAFEANAANQGRQLLEQALELANQFPAYREFFRALAARHLAGDLGEFERRLSLALALDPDDPFLILNMATALSLANNDEEALAWFDKALEKKPDDPLTLRRKGISLSRLDRTDEAILCFQQALLQNPHDPAAMRNLGSSLANAGRNDEALIWFDRALTENPRDYAAMRHKGVAYSSLGRHAEALKWYDRALELNPGSLATLINKARTLIENRDYENAAKVYDSLIAGDRNNPFHYLEKAIALAKLGRSDEAAVAIEEAYGLPNPSVTLRRGKSYWLNRLGLEEPAAKTAAGSVPAEPDAGREYGDIARVMEKTWEIFREDILSFRKNIEEAKSNFNLFINSPGMFRRDKIFLLGARKWNSFTPTLPLGENAKDSVGGGYFLHANGVGTVIDPGFDFLENFNAMGGRLADIQNVVVTHAHNDHTNDLESILTLFYQRNKNAGRSSSVSSRLGRGQKRPVLNLYMNLGSFQKFSPMLNLRASEHIGVVKTITPGDELMLGDSGIKMRVLPANHDEIFSKTYAVGLHFTLPSKPAKTLLFTGDTGLFPAGQEITADNVAELEIGRRYGIKPGELDYLVPHLGSIGDNELKSPDRQDGLGESFYPNHLGVQGTIRLITMLRPRYVFVSEFGEELKGFIVLLMELIKRCVRELGGGDDKWQPVILPMDLYFFSDLNEEKIYCARSESFEPLPKVCPRHMDKNDISQFYYERADARPGAGSDEYFAMKKLEYACKTNSGPFSDKPEQTARMAVTPGSGRF